MDKELKRIELDFDKLKEWRDVENDNIPLCSFATLYRIIGVNEVVEEYYKEHPDVKFTPFLNLFTNPLTAIKIKRFIADIWATHDLLIDKNEHVFWDPDSKYGKEEHYKKTLKAAVNDAVNRDFLDYCPGADPSLPDDVLVVMVEEDDHDDVIENEA